MRLDETTEDAHYGTGLSAEARFNCVTRSSCEEVDYVVSSKPVLTIHAFNQILTYLLLIKGTEGY